MSFEIARAHRKIVLPPTPALINLFPDSLVDLRAGKRLVLSHEVEQTVMLRNMGIDIPSPAETYYEFTGTPFEAQRKTVGMLTTNTRAYVLSGMGTGKTKCPIWAFDFLRKEGYAQRMLVVAPLSTLNFVWAREIFQTAPHLRAAVLHGSKARRLKRLAEDHDIYIINHDGVNTMLDEIMARDDINCLTLDELAVYRNGKAARTKHVRSLANKMAWAWGMTGSPTPNEPADAWAQCSILTPWTVPRYAMHFRQTVMKKVSTFKWAAKDNANDEVFRVMQPAVRYTLDDVTELPELVTRQVDIDLGPKQKAVYTKMKDQAAAMVADERITAQNAGAVYNKLLQISLGWVYTNDKQIVKLDNENRVQRLVDDCNSTPNKVLVFVPFVHVLNGLVEALRLDGIDVEMVYGATPRKERDELFTKFQQTSSVRVLVAHPQCMAHGLTLTAADTTIWYGPHPSLEIFDQANARFRRVGQKRKQQLLLYQSTQVERKTYATLRSRQNVQNNLLSMFAGNS